MSLTNRVSSREFLNHEDAGGQAAPDLIHQEIAKQLAQFVYPEVAGLKRRIEQLEQHLDLKSGADLAEIVFDAPSFGYSPLPALTANEYMPKEQKPQSFRAESGEDDPLPERLVALQALQQLLIAGFSQVNNQHLVNSHWKAPAHRQRVVSDCFYSKRTIQDQPIFFLVICTIATVLLMLPLKSESIDLFRAMYPRKESGVAIWLFLNLSWFIQTVYTPAIFAVETAALIAMSKDILSVIMNMLAVTFLLDIDNMMYVHLLSAESKAAYQKHANHPDRHAVNENAMRAIGLGMLCVMLSHLCGIRLLKDSSGESFLIQQKSLWASYVIAIGLRGAFVPLATQNAFDDTFLQAAMRVCARAVFASLAGYGWFFCLFWLTTGLLLGINDGTVAIKCCSWANE